MPEDREMKSLDKQLLAQKEMNREQGAYSALMQNDTELLDRQQFNQDLTKWQQNLEDDLDMLQHDLRSERLIDGNWLPVTIKNYNEKGELIEYAVRPLMNESGIYRVSSIVKRYLTRNVMMSNLSESIICRIMKGMVTDLVVNVGMNWKEYEIDYTDLSLIVRMIKDTVEPTLYRCLNNGERNYLNTINKRVEAWNMNPSKEKKGFLGLGGN